MNLGYKGINGFVKYLSQINSHNNSIPGNLFMTPSSLKEMVLDIVDLYTLELEDVRSYMLQLVKKKIR